MSFGLIIRSPAWPDCNSRDLLSARPKLSMSREQVNARMLVSVELTHCTTQKIKWEDWASWIPITTLGPRSSSLTLQHFVPYSHHDVVLPRYHLAPRDWSSPASCFQCAMAPVNHYYATSRLFIRRWTNCYAGASSSLIRIAYLIRYVRLAKTVFRLPANM